MRNRPECSIPSAPPAPNGSSNRRVADALVDRRPSPVARSHVRSFARSLVRSLARSLARPIARSLARAARKMRDTYLPSEGEGAAWDEADKEVWDEDEDGDGDDGDDGDGGDDAAAADEPGKDGWGFGKIGSFLQTATGNKVLTAADLEPVLDGMREHLISKNVAAEIAEDVCASVGATLEGHKLTAMTRVKSAVRDALKVRVSCRLLLRAARLEERALAGGVDGSAWDSWGTDGGVFGIVASLAPPLRGETGGGAARAVAHSSLFRFIPFHSIPSARRGAARREAAVLRVLTPKRSTDVLRDVLAARDKKKVFSIVFVGINGVGKSTSLAKVSR